jgi:putative inorganic carbon (HCO3(-)) transporter
MNITKSDLFYILMSIAVSAIGVVAVSNLNTQFGLYSLLGLIGIMMIFVIIVKPNLGANILIIAILINLSYVLAKQGYPGGIEPFVIMVASALLIRYFYAGQTLTAHSRTFRVEFFLILYFIVVAASFLVAADKQRAWADILNLAKDIIIIYCILFALQRSSQWKQATWLIIITTAVLCAFSTYQFLTQNYEQTFFEFASITMARVDGDSLSARAGGPVNAPNIWAQILVAISMLLIFRIIYEKHTLIKLAGVVMLGMILYTVLNAYSRAAYLVLAIDVILILLVLKRHVNPFVAFAGLGVMVLLFQFLPASYQDRISTLSFFTSDTGIYEDSSFRGRSSEMLTGLAMFAAHPVFGIGTANYRPSYQQYTQLVGLEFRAEARDPHSLYVQILAETGILGAIAFLGLVFSLLNALNKACLDIEQSPRLSEWLPWMNAIRLAIMSYLLTSFFMHNAYFRYFWILVAMGLAGIQITYNLLNRSERETSIEARL